MTLLPGRRRVTGSLPVWQSMLLAIALLAGGHGAGGLLGAEAATSIKPKQRESARQWTVHDAARLP